MVRNGEKIMKKKVLLVGKNTIKTVEVYIAHINHIYLYTYLCGHNSIITSISPYDAALPCININYAFNNNQLLIANNF